MQVTVHRCALARLRKAVQAGQVTLGFIGGSITAEASGCSWADGVAAWLVQQFPDARVRVENAAIGATGSELAVFRAERDLIERGCDVVFIEFAVNDGGQPTGHRRRTQEGLIRKLLAGEGRDVVLAYAYCQAMYDDMVAGRMPPTVREFEELGEHYGIPSVWMGLHALREVMAGKMRWQQWLPDGLHPGHLGGRCYAESVTAFLERELIASASEERIPTGPDRPQPLDPGNWEGARRVPLSDARLEGPWTLRRCVNVEWIDHVLDTAAPGARLAFEFEGRALSLGLDFGKAAADFRYSLDGAPWDTVALERPEWCGVGGWYHIVNLADDLEAGRHAVELEVVHGNRPECQGTNFRLALIGVVP